VYRASRRAANHAPTGCVPRVKNGEETFVACSFVGSSIFDRVQTPARRPNVVNPRIDVDAGVA
jgi:hypothetical protein